jgi:hypothetical protein
MEKKLTKKDYYAALRAMVEGVETVGDIPADEVLAFIDKTVDQIDAKAAKAKEKASEKKAEGDALRAEVAGVLTSELQTIDAITAQIDVEGITKSKVTARLTQLVKTGVARKEQVKDGDRKVMGYALADGDVDESVDVDVDESVDAEPVVTEE